MTEKELVRTINLFYEGHMSKEAKAALKLVLKKLTDREQKKVLSKVTFLEYKDGREKDSKEDGPLGMLLQMCRPSAPKHSFDYLMLINLSAHKDRDDLPYTIAHEMAHFLLGHGKEHCDEDEHIRHDQEADQWCKEHGFLPFLNPDLLNLVEVKDV